MTRSLADNSSFVPMEYVKGKGPCGPEIGRYFLLQTSAVARLIFVSLRAWFSRGIGGRVYGFLLEGCRSIPLTKRLPIAPAERVNRQPSFFPNYLLVPTFHHDWLTSLVLASNVRLPRVRTSILFLTKADQAANRM